MIEYESEGTGQTSNAYDTKRRTKHLHLLPLYPTPRRTLGRGQTEISPAELLRILLASFRACSTH